MAKDGRERGPATDERDFDQVDFAWLASLFARLRRRMFPDDSGVTATAREPETGPGARDIHATRTGVDVVDLPPEEESPGASSDVEDRPHGGRGARAILRARRAGLLEPKYVIPLTMAFLIAIVCVHNQFDGVDWGDDFALYVHQAKALTVGNLGEVLQQTRFSVDNSGWSTFSPYSYPWGWPLLMAPVYVVFGLDYDMLKLLEVAAFCVFLLVFFALVRRRTGLPAATILTLLFAVSRSFNGATDSVLSDLPYLCFAMLSLWFMDRCRESGRLLSDRRALVILGLLLAFTWNVRREGIALVVALAALHFAVLTGLAARDRSGKARRGVNWRYVALPYLCFAVATVGFQLLLPGVFIPNIPGTSLANVSPHISYYKDILGEHLGLKDPGAAMQLFHSASAALLAIRLFVLLAAVGVVARLLHRFEEDVHLAAFLGGSLFIMMVSPYQDSRYFFTITPLLAYFAYQALPTLVAMLASGRALLGRLAAVLPAAALVGLVMLCGNDLLHAIEYHRDYHYTVNGPESPDARQMFTAVKELTRGDDVILFNRARAMTLYTDRLAIQGSNLDLLLPRSDWYVMAKGSNYSQTLLNDAEADARHLTKAWENGSWVIWRVPPRA